MRPCHGGILQITAETRDSGLAATCPSLNEDHASPGLGPVQEKIHHRLDLAQGGEEGDFERFSIIRIGRFGGLLVVMKDCRIFP